MEDSPPNRQDFYLFIYFFSTCLLLEACPATSVPGNIIQLLTDHSNELLFSPHSEHSALHFGSVYVCIWIGKKKPQDL